MKLPHIRQPATPLIMAVILLLALCLRFWNLPQTLMFQGDQGRDALTVARIFTDRDLVFIGPVTSVGNMYLGPLYYYFMLPFLFLSYPSPVGPAYAVAALGVLTIFLLYRWGQELIGKPGAVIAAFLYTVSAITITYSRFSWNPNPAPLVTLMMLYGTYKAWRQDPRYWLLVGLSFSLLIQLHYLTLISLGGAGLIWLWQLIDLVRHRSQPVMAKTLRSFGLATAGAILIFLLSLTPLLLFDLKHDWLNLKAFGKVFIQEEALISRDSPSLSNKIISTVKETHGRSLHILFETTLGQNRTLNNSLLLVTIAVLTLKLKERKNKFRAGEIVILCYLATGIIGTALYEHTVFDHYIAYLFPVVFLVFGMALSWFSRHKAGWILAVGFCLFFTWNNARRWPLTSGHWTIFDMQVVTDSIHQRLDKDEKYSLVLLSPSGDLYGQNYRYFLSTTDTEPLAPENANEAETLVIINEEHTANVADLPIYEIATFPGKNLSEVYTIDHGPEIIIFRK